MTFKDDPFKPYQLIYRHNVRNYARFLSKKDHSKYLFFPYLISTPFKVNNLKTKNDYLIKVAILVKNKDTKEITIEFEEFDFKTLLYLNMYSKINKEGDVTLFEELNAKFSNSVSIQDIMINDTTEMEVLSLEDVSNRFGILCRCDINLHPDFKNLEFYLYKIEGQNVLIPAIEVMKYFYVYDWQGNLKSHFLNDILTPNGITSSYSGFKPVGHKYEFEINSNYSISDRYKILFFALHKKRLEMYSSIFNTYNMYHKISAKIPRDDVILKTRGFNYKDKNLLLVLNILKHDHDETKDFLTNLSFTYTHKNSKFHEEDKGLRDTEKDRHKTKVNNENMEFNDNLYGNTELIYDDETEDSYEVNIEKIAIDIKSNLHGLKEIEEQREQQGSKTIYGDSTEDIASTTKGDIGNQDNAVSESAEEPNELEEQFKITINEITQYIEDEAEFQLLDHKNFQYPTVFDDKGKRKKTAFMFIDKKKKIKRKYDIVKVKYKLYYLYIIELQPKLDGSTKSILTLVDSKDVTNITDINKEYVDKELCDFINQKDRSWFTGKLNLDENKFFTFKPSGTMKGYKNKLKKHIEK